MFLGCNGTFYDSRGVLASPNYPFHYNIMENCVDKIVQPLGSTISYKFDVFDVEEYYDNVSVSSHCSL